ncbi:MAG TPA: tetratricopeptide repeat protein, partial [Gemmataceae bacterium]|nr:tetratricopeptide repeat protein [Gemmataceae bacterium]
ACVLPMLATLLQNAGINVQGAVKDGVCSRLTGVLLGSFSPDLLAVLLLLVTVGLYLWLRPRKRDLFWDVIPASPEKLRDLAEEPYDAGDKACGAEWVKRLLAEEPESQATLLLWAERQYREQHYQEALTLYRKALRMGPAPAAVYSRAALAAGRLQKNGLALSILTEATEKLRLGEVTGAMWYNMGCFAARLGMTREAMRYLNRAIDAGYTSLRKYRTDPDLNTLRSKREFRTLLACLD